jgi:carbamoyl-phosphate synthase large subunit
MKKILFISGGIWQKSFVEYLKDKENFIAIVNPVENDTTRICDLHIKCDINNTEEIENQINKINPDLVTSDQSDISTKIVSEIATKYNLPGNHPDVIEKFSNKHEIYNFASKIGIPVPETILVESVQDLIVFAEKVKFPIIIKPTDSTMSRGFNKINSIEEINEEIINNSKQFSKSKKIISQNFIEGNMITCEGVCSGSMHKTLASSIKISEDYFSPGITSSVRYPAKCPKEIIEKIINANDQYVEKSGMRFGLTHSEYIFKDNNFHLIEIGARGGGAGISDKIVPWTSGVSNYDIFYRSLMGEICDVKSIQTLNRPAILRYYKKEDVNELQAKEINKIEGVAIFFYNFLGTQYVSDKNDCRYSMAIYTAKDEEEMECINQKINCILNN